MQVRGSWAAGAGRAVGGGGARRTWMSSSGGRMSPGTATSPPVGSSSSSLAASLVPSLPEPLSPTSSAACASWASSPQGGIASSRASQAASATWVGHGRCRTHPPRSQT